MIGRLVDQDPVRRGRGLQTRGRVHDVPGGHAFSFRRPGTERHERFPGRDGDPHLEAVVLRDPVPDRERGPDRTLRVVLVCDRRPEERHDRIADELLDRAAVALDLGLHASPVGRLESPDLLGVEALGA